MGDAADDLQYQHDMEDLMARRGNGGNDKYLRLTGLWQSKTNTALWTGRAKTEQIELLIKQCEEALDNDAPLVFSLWENDKKKSRQDPEFSIQSFVGDAEEKPRSSRSSRPSRDKEEDREDSRDRKRSKRDEPEDEPEDAPEDAPADEPEEKPQRRTSSRKEAAPAKSTKRRADW